MRGLPEKFTKYGQQFEQLCRTSDAAIEQQDRAG